MSDFLISQDELDKLFNTSKNSSEKKQQPRAAMDTDKIINKEHPSTEEIKVEIAEQHVSLTQSEVDALLNR